MKGDDSTLYNEEADSRVFSRARSIDFISLLEISNELKQKYSFKQVKDFPKFLKFIKSKGFKLTENEIKQIYNNIFNTPEDRLQHLADSQHQLRDIESVGRHSLQAVDTVYDHSEALTHILRYATTEPKSIFDESTIVTIKGRKIIKNTISDFISSNDGNPVKMIPFNIMCTSNNLRQAVNNYWGIYSDSTTQRFQHIPIIIVLSAGSGHRGHSSVLFLFNEAIWSVAVGYYGISEENEKIYHQKQQNWGEEIASFINISNGALYTPDPITSLTNKTSEGIPYRYVINDMRVATKQDIEKLDMILKEAIEITYIPESIDRRIPASFYVNLDKIYSTLSTTCSDTINCASFASQFTDNLRIMFTRFVMPSNYCPFTTDEINLILSYIINKPQITDENRDEYNTVLSLLQGKPSSKPFSIFSRGGKKSRRPKHIQKRKTYKKI